MKIAFLVLNHRGPEQLIRLLATLRSQIPDSPIVIHHDAFHGELPSALLEPMRDVHLLESGKHVSWGDYGLVDVCLWSMAWMREHLEFDWMVLLSAQDYPIKPLAGFADDLTRDGADAVFAGMPIRRMPLGSRIMMNRRYFYKYRPVTLRCPHWLPGGAQDILRRGAGIAIRALNNLQPLFKVYRLAENAPYRIGRRTVKTPFGREWPCWHASQWFALSRGAFDYVLDYIADHPKYAEHYRSTLCPDESMLASLVFNSPHLRVANRDVTYTRWANSTASHPDVFQAADLDELAAAPQYFARKFDLGQDADILEALDKHIGQDTYRVAKVEG